MEFSEDSSSSSSKSLDDIHNTASIEDEEEIEVLDNRGEHVNKSAEFNWQGEELLSEYLNDDSDPEVIVKRLPQINHSQQVTVEYLNPLTVPPAGDFDIIQEANIIDPAIIVHQKTPRSFTPEPIIYREEPPTPPETIEVENILDGDENMTSNTSKSALISPISLETSQCIQTDKTTVNNNYNDSDDNDNDLDSYEAENDEKGHLIKICPRKTNAADQCLRDDASDHDNIDKLSENCKAFIYFLVVL